MRDLRGDRVQRADIREERLRTTSALRAGAGLTSWRGRSGRRYVVGIHALDEPDMADVTEAVVLAVQRYADGVSELLDISVPSSAASRRSRLRWLALMRVRGATEMHVHLLAEDEAERGAVLRDLTD